MVQVCDENWGRHIHKKDTANKKQVKIKYRNWEQCLEEMRIMKKKMKKMDTEGVKEIDNYGVKKINCRNICHHYLTYLLKIIRSKMKD